MPALLPRLVLFTTLAVACLHPGHAAAQSIVVSGDHFVVDWNDGNGPQAKFLVFISYFDAMRATDLNGDLDYIKNTLGFDGVRIMPNWARRNSTLCGEETSDRLMDASGNIQTGPLQNLINLIAAARTKKLIVDVTFTRETFGLNDDPAEWVPVNDYIDGVTEVASHLTSYRNVIFDMQNEYDNGNRMSPSQLSQLRASIHAVDTTRIITASRGDPAQDALSENSQFGSSAIAYHDPRGAGWETRVPSKVASVRPSGKPIYLQEPEPWNSGLTVCPKPGKPGVEGVNIDADGNPDHFRTAVANARASGAAAWTFHTRQSFRLHVTPTFASRLLSIATEKDLLEGTATIHALSHIAATGTWGISPITLTIHRQGTGTGTVSSTPSGISCDVHATHCVAAFDPNTSVTLTATPASGSVFSGWSGDCTGTSTCTVKLYGARSVTAEFTAVSPHLVSSLDVPADGATVTNVFPVGGWALDPTVPTGTGVDGVTVNATPPGGGTATSLGTASYGISRPDIGAIYGSHFTPSGFSLMTSPVLSPGAYDIFISAHLTTDGLMHDAPSRKRVYVVTKTDLRRAGDFDGDLRSDIAVYNTASGAWVWLTSSSNFATSASSSWGGTTYLPAPGDYDGDGKADLGVYVQSTATWYVLLSGANFTTSMTQTAGGPGWAPVPGDYDGDGKTDFAVYNTTTGTWYGLKSTTNYTTSFNIAYGGTGWTAVPADFDGDGKTDIGVYQASTATWSVPLSSTNFTTSVSQSAGGTGWMPVAADYDGDGKADVVVYNTSTGVWYGLMSRTNYTTSMNVGWGGAGYTPVKGDYDGDGKADLAVYTGGTWYILLSGADYTTSLSRTLGGLGYIPVPQYP